MSFIRLPNRPVILSVCCSAETGPKSSAHNCYQEVSLRELTLGRLKTIRPDAVISWLFCSDYDVFDVARALHDNGYDGQLIAMSDPLPDKAMICGEIKTHFPNLRFDLSFTGKVGKAAHSYFKDVALELA